MPQPERPSKSTDEPLPNLASPAPTDMTQPERPSKLTNPAPCVPRADDISTPEMGGGKALASAAPSSAVGSPSPATLG